MSQITPAGSESPVKRVLVVEDDDDLRGMMQELLIGAGYECIDAQDGLEALDWLSQVPVDLVVADILMPRMAGPELIAKIRRTRAWAGKPILLLSGYANLVPPDVLPAQIWGALQPRHLRGCGRRRRGDGVDRR